MRGDEYVSYYNCLDAAFQNAVRILQSRTTQFGARSQTVKDWIAAQDQVFENCSNGIGYTAKPQPAVIPAAARPEDPAIARADRAYQIAAAYFYAGDLDTAQEAFQAIAQDPASPYSAIAPYLVAHVLIRKATLGGDDDRYDPEILAKAEAQLNAVLDDKNSAEFHPAARRLLGYTRIRLHRQERLRELEASLQSRAPSKSFDQDLTDYLWLLDRPVLTKTVIIAPAENGKPPQKGVAVDESSRLHGDDMTDWILSFNRSCGDCFNHSLERWNTTKSLPWLVAAMAQSDAKNPAIPALLAAASKIAPDSPAYLTMTFHRLRLLAQSGNLDAARHDLDDLLAQQTTSMPISARNEFRALRMKLAPNLYEFLQFAPRVSTEASNAAPLPSGKSDYAPGTWDYAATRPHFDSDASVVLTEKLPLHLLADATQSTALPPSLRADVAIAAWTRAIELRNEVVAREMTPVLAELVPELKDDLAAYAAADPDSRQFTAIFAILRNPGFRPFVSASPGRGWFYSANDTRFNSIDNFSDNWWCAFEPSLNAQRSTGGYYLLFATLRGPLQEIYPQGVVPEPVFLSAEDKSAARNEVTALSALPSAPRWLGQLAVEWAIAHPDDPRVPESLHDVVRAWRYGCTEPSQAGTTETTSGTSAQKEKPNYSKLAFQLLHSRYPDNPWTKKTPDWFN